MSKSVYCLCGFGSKLVIRVEKATNRFDILRLRGGMNNFATFSLLIEWNPQRITAAHGGNAQGVIKTAEIELSSGRKRRHPFC